MVFEIDQQDFNILGKMVVLVQLLTSVMGEV
jgi:hypothetical protein